MVGVKVKRKTEPRYEILAGVKSQLVFVSFLSRKIIPVCDPVCLF